MILISNQQKIGFHNFYNYEDDKDFVSIDAWKPKILKTTNFRTPSKWREKQNKKYNFYICLDNDTIYKVIAHIKAEVDDSFIVKVFKINLKKINEIKFWMQNGKTNTEIIYLIRKNIESRFENPEKKKSEPKICTAKDCINIISARSLCPKHLTRLKKHGVIYDDELIKIGVQVKAKKDILL